MAVPGGAGPAHLDRQSPLTLSEFVTERDSTSLKLRTGLLPTLKGLARPRVGIDYHIPLIRYHLEELCGTIVTVWNKFSKIAAVMKFYCYFC